jgi:hypothetical protein
MIKRSSRSTRSSRRGSRIQQLGWHTLAGESHPVIPPNFLLIFNWAQARLLELLELLELLSQSRAFGVSEQMDMQAVAVSVTVMLADIDQR